MRNRVIRIGGRQMKIAIIGANEYQTKLILKCKENNIETHVFAWEDDAVGKQYSDYFYSISIRNKEEILKKCIEIKIDGILSIGSDLAMLTVNYIAEKMNLIGNSMLSTKLSTDKYEMRKALKEKGLPCPEFIKVKENYNKENVNNMSLPIIVKPTDRSGSRGVTKVSNIDQLYEAISIAMKESFSKEIIVEQYIDGREYSLEFMSDNGVHEFLAITEKFTTGSPHFIEKAHLQPARIDKNILKNAINIAKQGLDALEIKNGASHTEIKIYSNEVFIIEIGARMGGDFIGSDLVLLSTGIDFTQLVLDKASGKIINIEKKCSKCSFIYFIFNEDDLKNIKNNYNNIKKYIVEDHFEEIEEFTDVTDSSNRHGYVIFQFDNYSEFELIEKIIFTRKC